MRVLAIDTALGACAAAVFDTAQGEIIASESLLMDRGHAEALIPLMSRVMTGAAMPFGALGRIVVTTGPGSFTGMRVGIAAARGLGVATKVPVVGVTTLSAFAAPYLAADERTPVAAAIDARHQHVYLQVFGAGGRTLVAPRLMPIEEALRAALQNAARIVGSAARAVAEAGDARRLEVIDSGPAPDIAWVARIGAVIPETDAAPKPQYLRAPDAQPQYAAQLPRR
jgi:tRNA threonylcarbamoyladenosine biosynthesis protein TsaB